jgi:hypothetical protein
MSSYCGLLIGNLDCEPLSCCLLPRALWSGGSGFAARGSGRALAPVYLGTPSFLVIPRGGHEILPSGEQRLRAES